jgi:hypothetical protein
MGKRFDFVLIPLSMLSRRFLEEMKHLRQGSPFDITFM